MSTAQLPPFPDELIAVKDVGRAALFLQGLRLPPRLAARHLRRYAAAVGATLSPELLRAVWPQYPRVVDE
jgi:hypothetical protein